VRGVKASPGPSAGWRRGEKRGAAEERTAGRNGRAGRRKTEDRSPKSEDGEDESVR